MEDTSPRVYVVHEVDKRDGEDWQAWSAGLFVGVEKASAAGKTVAMLGDSLTYAGIITTTVQGHLDPLGVTTTNHAISGKTWQWYRDDLASPLPDVVAAEPDVVTWLLAHNGVFTAQPGDGLANYIQAEIDAANEIMATFPATTKHVIMPPVPGNDRQSAFDANYGGYVTADRERWRRRAHQVMNAYVAAWSGRSDIILFSGHTAIHRTDGFPSNNAIHPNAAGYTSIGDAFAPAILYALQQQEGS